MRFNSARILTAAAALAYPFGASAWYLQVHNQIAHLAETFLNPNTVYFINEILDPEYKGSIGRAAAWADTIKKSHMYSYGWHFISALSSPPESCGLYYHRDCQKGGCVVQQINNQTGILRGCLTDLRNGRYKPDVDCQQALKWVVHFLGDVHQPLHASERAIGGNGVKVLFNGTETNMHQTWDRWILYAETNHPDGFSADAIDPYFADLRQRILADTFREPRSTWDPCNWQVSRGTYCPEKWAQQSNALTCDYVYSRYVNETTDLYPEYAKGAFHLVELQLVKAAWRTAGWLNTLATLHFGPSFGEDDLDVNPGLQLPQRASWGGHDGRQRLLQEWEA